MPISRPNSDISSGNWTNQVGSSSNLYQSIDEVTLDISDYIKVVSAPFAGDPDLPVTIGLSTATTLVAGESYIMSCYATASYLTGSARTLRWQLLESGIVKETTDILVNNSPGAPLYTHVVAASISTPSALSYRWTLLHDGSDWRVDVYQAQLGIVFPHLDLASDGTLQVVAANSGRYLELGSDGIYVLKSGTEGVGSLVLGSDGTVKIHD